MRLIGDTARFLLLSPFPPFQSAGDVENLAKGALRAHCNGDVKKGYTAPGDVNGSADRTFRRVGMAAMSRAELLQLE